MVNKLLDFSSIEGGRMSFKFRPVSIGPLTRDLAVLFRDAIERTKIEYVIDCDDDPPDVLPVYLSTDVWEKIVGNLVSDALKYSVKGRIAVTLRSTRGEAVLSVSDTGQSPSSSYSL
jgi:signal transduction histidine kinase